MTERWHNWSGSVVATPAQIAAPRTEDELAAVVRAATRLRVVGAGPSFSPLCATDGTLVRLDGLAGAAGSVTDPTGGVAPRPAGKAGRVPTPHLAPLELAPDGRSAWAPAGWSLRRVAAEARAARSPRATCSRSTPGPARSARCAAGWIRSASLPMITWLACSTWRPRNAHDRRPTTP